MNILPKVIFGQEEDKSNKNEILVDPVCDILYRFTIEDYSKTPRNSLTDLTKFLSILNSEKINIEELKQLTIRSFPNGCKGLRSLIWRLLLGQLPLNATEWLKEMEKNKKEYEEFKKELIIKPTLGVVDHPLSQGSSSKWNIFFQDKEQTEEISNDIQRTRPEMSFVNEPASFNPSETNSDIMIRILFIYTKLNPGIKYVQGMNEILMMLYYTIIQDSFDGYNGYIESETFVTFSRMMGEIQNNFLRDLDKSEYGVDKQLDSVSKLVKQHLPDIWMNLKVLKIDFKFFALRWVLLLLSQEYSVDETQKLWDLILSARIRYSFLNYLILGLLINQKKELMSDDFSIVMKTLQKSANKIKANDLKIIALHAYKSDIDAGRI